MRDSFKGGDYVLTFCDFLGHRVITSKAVGILNIRLWHKTPFCQIIKLSRK